MNGKFIKIDKVNKAQAAKLRNLGFTEITEEGSPFYCFLNNGSFTFSDDDTKNMVFTDTFCM